MVSVVYGQVEVTWGMYTPSCYTTSPNWKIDYSDSLYTAQESYTPDGSETGATLAIGDLILQYLHYRTAKSRMIYKVHHHH